MTIQELSDKFSKFTGIHKDIGALIEGASTNDEKKKVYDHLMWHLRRGRILERPWDKALFEAIVPALQEKLNIESSVVEEIEEQETYTAEEAAAYNLTLEGALAYGAVKTPAVEAVEAKPAIYSFSSFSTNDDAPFGTGTVKVISQDLNENATTVEVLTNEPAGNTTAEEAAEFVGKQYDVHATELEDNKHYNLYSEYGLEIPIYVTVELVSEAVEAVEAQEAVLYTNEEVDAYNAELDGAKHAGDAKE